MNTSKPESPTPRERFLARQQEARAAEGNTPPVFRAASDEPETPPAPPMPEPEQPPGPGPAPAPEPPMPAGALPTWESIDSAPRNDSDVTVRYGEDDAEGRIVRWRLGRRFTGRRWVEGGKWVPSDNMIPLPAGEPTHWLKYPEPEVEPVSEVEAAA